MRVLLAALGALGFYWYLKERRERGPAGLLRDMRGERPRRTRRRAPRVVYEVVEHDGGWAYKVNDVFSESYPTRGEAVRAAEHAAEAHRSAGDDEVIEYQGPDGQWHEEVEPGDDRPDTRVKGSAGPSGNRQETRG